MGILSEEQAKKINEALGLEPNFGDHSQEGEAVLSSRVVYGQKYTSKEVQYDHAMIEQRIRELKI